MNRVIPVVVMLIAAQGLGWGCGIFHDAARPTAYGAELAACVEASDTRAAYLVCCVDAARRYGRDPEFCFDDKDGGAR
jgi:2-C-methyl-D-erythritol 4-phosphate cytidylyltransferase